MARMGAHLNQFLKYFGVAAVGYIFDFGMMVGLHEILHIHYLPAAIAGFIFGLVVVYILSNRYVFGRSKLNSKSVEFGIFALIGVIGLGVLTTLMWLLTDIAHLSYLVSKILATVAVYMWNFLARRSLYHNYV